MPRKISRAACRPLRARSRGSLLIVAMLLAAIIGISLVTYLKLCATSLRSASRSFLNNAAMNLAETGVEQALYCFNKNPAWPGWTISGNNATRTFSGFAPAPGATAVVKTYVQNYNGTAVHPLIVSKSIITPADGPTLSKYIEVTVRKRSIFGFGLLAVNALIMNPTNNTCDSWSSNPSGDPATPPVPYSSSVARTNAMVGSPSTANGAVNIGQSKIYGYVASGGGTIITPSGSIVSGSFAGTGVDPTRLAYDFAATFSIPVAPVPSATNTISASITSSLTLPRAGDVAAADGRYYYSFAAGTNINLQTTNRVTIANNVTLLMNNHQGAIAIGTTESASLTVNTGGSLQVYTNGDVLAGGTGGFLNNTPQPSNCLLYGTGLTPGGQRWELEGNNVIPPNFAIYAPNARFTISSNAEFKGAVVAYSITLSADTAFHYDESLANLGGNPYGLSKWKELQSAAARATYLSQLNF